MTEKIKNFQDLSLELTGEQINRKADLCSILSLPYTRYYILINIGGDIMLNKILLRKIKFPLLLRGAFSFCHSRLSAVPAQAGESENPSSLSLRGALSHVIARERSDRSNLNYSGFSLIELMVAVVILSMVIFGIFQAYSAGFMGMADARDRTVATNYAQEAMEDVKNMDFELITNENLSTPEIIDGKFNRVVTISDEYDNLKKITTRVFWTNRKGQIINIDTTMHINKTQFNPGVAAKIILYANPYYTVLPSSGIVNLIAIVKDENGNTKIDWDDGDIHFAVLGTGYSDFPKDNVGSYLGYLGNTPGADEIAIIPTNGKAETTFTASNYTIGSDIQQGDVIIKAWIVSPDITSNPITITVTLDVVRIDLSADPTSIKADGTSTSTVTAALKNSGGITVEDATNNITFHISGEGTFVNSEGVALPNTITLTPPNVPGGIATILVKSINNTPGVASVTASSEGLLSDTVNVITTGDPHSISVSVNPVFIYTDNLIGTEVTVTIKDVNGNPVKYTGSINLSISGGTGTFSINPVNFSDATSAFTTFSSTTPGIIIIIASGGVGLISGSATIEVRSALIADNITLTAVPQNILAGGGNTSEITATVKQGTTTVSKYNNDITFKIISDTSLSKDAVISFNSNNYATNVPLTITGIDYGNDGVAVVQLLPASNVGTVTIKVSTYNSLGTYIEKTINVGFYSNAHHINLSAIPQQMLVNGETCTITATIVDASDTLVSNYNEEITFTILEGRPSTVKFTLSNTSSLTQTVINGVSPVGLTSQSKAGTVKMRATSFTGTSTIEGYLNIPVGIIVGLANPPNIIYNNTTKEVNFDINVQGAALILEEMKVSWLPVVTSESLKEIKVNGIGVYSSSASNGVVVDVTDTTLAQGVSNIKMYFDPGANISGKTINVVFNPNSGSYLVVVTVP